MALHELHPWLSRSSVGQVNIYMLFSKGSFEHAYL